MSTSRFLLPGALLAAGLAVGLAGCATPADTHPLLGEKRTSADRLPFDVDEDDEAYFDPATSLYLGEHGAHRFYLAAGRSSEAPAACIVITGSDDADDWVSACGGRSVMLSTGGVTATLYERPAEDQAGDGDVVLRKYLVVSDGDS